MSKTKQQGKRSRKRKEGPRTGEFQRVDLKLDLDFLSDLFSPTKHADNIASTVHHFSDCANDFLNGRAQRKESALNGEAFRNEIPSVIALNDSLTTYFRKKSYSEILATFLKGVQIASVVLDILYGDSAMKEIGLKIAGALEAQVGLDSPEKFANHVYLYIQMFLDHEPLEGVQHLYFLYHPGTNWHSEFKAKVKEKPISANFIGMSDNLDSIVAYMRFFRWYLNKKKKPKPAVFHLLMPAYRTTVIRDPLEFPDLGALVIHGEKPDENPYVWLNLPTLKDDPGKIVLRGVRNMADGESTWMATASEYASHIFGSRFFGPVKPRVIGEAAADSDSISVCSTTAEYGSS